MNKETLADKIILVVMMLVCLACLFAILHIDGGYYYTDIPTIAAVELKTFKEEMK